MTTPTPLEETWWEVTTSTGLILTLPAPLQPINTTGWLVDKEPRPMAMAPMPMHEAFKQTALASHSKITGLSYGLSMRDVTFIRQTTKSNDPERLQRATLKASRTAPTPSSDSGQEVISPSAAPASPTGPSTGARIRRNIH